MAWYVYIGAFYRNSMSVIPQQNTVIVIEKGFYVPYNNRSA